MKIVDFISENTRSFIKSLFVTIAGGVVAVVAPSIQDGSFIFNWTIIWHTAVASGLAYISNKLLYPVANTIHIDPEKTSVVDKNTKEVIVNAKK